MPELKDPVNKPRRRFLGGLMAGISGALALSGFTRAAGTEAKDSTTPAQKAAHKGYHESAHVKTYYDKARF